MGRRQQREDENSDEVALMSEGGTRYKGVLVPQSGSNEEEAVPIPDPVADALGGQFGPDIVEEVKKYSAPTWEAEDSSLDGIDDLEEFALHGFKLTPAEHAEVERAAADEIAALETLRAPPGEALEARVAARRALAAGARGPREMAWLKHRAYYRAMARLRADKRRREAAAEAGGADGAAREAYLASKGAPLDVVPARDIDAAPADLAARIEEASARQQQQQQGASSSSTKTTTSSSGSKTTTTSGGGGGGYDPAWLTRDMRRHPQVVGAIAAAFSGALGARVAPPPGSGAAAVAERAALDKLGGGAAFAAALAEAEAAETEALAKQLALAQWEAAVREAAAAPAPRAAKFTPEHEAALRRERAWRLYRAGRSAAFWLSLMAALGTSGLRWWRGRGGGRPPTAGRGAAAAGARGARQPRRARAAGSVASSEATTGTLPAVYEAR